MNRLIVSSLAALLSFAAFASSPSDFYKKLTITVPDASVAEGVSLADFPVMVRLNTSIAGFSYDDFRLPNGGDLMFTSADGTTVYPHEVDTWNPAGDSFVWVKLPALARGVSFGMYFGNGATSPAAATDVWTEYIAVWHFGEASGDCADSTGNGFTATCAGTAPDTLVAVPAAIGDGRCSTSGSYMTIATTEMTHGGTFSVSGWFQNSTKGGALVDQKGAFSFRLQGNVTGRINVYGSDGSVIWQPSTPDMASVYRHIAVVYDVGDDAWSAYLYGDGGEKGSGLDKPLNNPKVTKDSTNPITVLSGTSVGGCDELRIAKKALSAVWVKAEYQTVETKTFLTYGAAELLDADVPLLDVPTVVRTADGFLFTVSLTNGSATVYAALNGDEENLIPVSDGQVAAPATVSTLLTDLAVDACYVFSAIGTKGTKVAKNSGTYAFYNGSPSIVCTKDAAEELLVPGEFVVSRADTEAAKAYDLVVAYGESGSAESGVDYVALPGTVTIPAGAASAAITVTPKLNDAKNYDTELMLTVAPGAYIVGEEPSADTMTIENLHPATDMTWKGGSSSDLADAANWDPSYEPKQFDTLTIPVETDSEYTLGKDIAVKAFTVTSESEPSAFIDLLGNTLLAYQGTLTFKGTRTTIANGTVEGQRLVTGTDSLAFSNAVLRLSERKERSNIILPGTEMDLVFSGSKVVAGYSYSGGDWGWGVKGDYNTILFHSSTNVSLDSSGTVMPFYLQGDENTMLLDGDSRFNASVFSVSGTNNVVTVKGAVVKGVSASNSSSASLSGLGNTLLVEGVDSSFSVVNQGISGSNNCFIARNGGTIGFGSTTASKTSLEGKRNCWIADHGTLTFRCSQMSLDSTSAGCRLEIVGDEAMAQMQDGFHCGNVEAAEPCVLSFTAGPTGFGGKPPMTVASSTFSGTFAINNNVELVVDGREVVTGFGTYKVPLIRASTPSNVLDIDYLNEHLSCQPKEAVLSWEGTGSTKTLYCTWVRKPGLMIIVK